MTAIFSRPQCVKEKLRDDSYATAAAVANDDVLNAPFSIPYTMKFMFHTTQ